MIEYMLARIICHEFEKSVGKGKHDTGKALHVGFHMNCGDSTDQYRVCHMYLYAPANYVYVTTQRERIDEEGDRHVEPMELLCYHDSCWRDAVQSFIFKHRGELNSFQSLNKLFDWHDVLTLSEEEREYLRLLGLAQSASKQLKINPFDSRTIWKSILR